MILKGFSLLFAASVGVIRRKTSKRWRETEHPVIVPDRTHLEVSTLSVGLSGMHLSVARGTNLGSSLKQGSVILQL